MTEVFYILKIPQMNQFNPLNTSAFYLPSTFSATFHRMHCYSIFHKQRHCFPIILVKCISDRKAQQAQGKQVGTQASVSLRAHPLCRLCSCQSQASGHPFSCQLTSCQGLLTTGSTGLKGQGRTGNFTQAAVSGGQWCQCRPSAVYQG